ncbi:MAG: CoA-binding protein [Deltaproteobacteria bacterium]|nr:CoA-binding protein [Deltaproteobacteria bacterium]
MNTVDHFLDKFFNPESIAMVGATNNPFKMNFQLTRNLVRLGFTGRIFPINPHSEEILGLKAYPALTDLHEPVDLVVSAVPALKTMGVMEQCARKGVKNVVIISGGFSEGGDEGQELHKNIGAFARRNGIRVLGPNTLSPVNTSIRLAVSFNVIKKMQRGGLSFAFQSGFYDPKMNWIFSNLAVNKMMDMGNKVDINEVDALEYFHKDPETEVIAMHIESLHGNARDFFNLLKTVSRRKPVIILKTGRTAAGSKAAASHTGALAGENDGVFDGVLRQAGAIRAQNLEEFFELAKAFQMLKPPRGPRLAIVTLSGGEGVMATDSCEAHGLSFARLDETTHGKLKRIFPKWEIPLNPFDAGICMEFHLSDIGGFFDTMLAIPEDNNVDCTVMQMPPTLLEAAGDGPEGGDDMAKAWNAQVVKSLIKMSGVGKPLILWNTSMGAEEHDMAVRLESNSIPVFPSSERAIKAVAALNRYRTFCQGG